MITGLSTGMQDMSDARKTAAINNELLRLQMDIVALKRPALPKPAVFEIRVSPSSGVEKLQKRPETTGLDLP